MSKNQQLLDRLEQLLSWKQSRKFYANKLGITEDEVGKLLIELRKKDSEDTSDKETDQLENSIVKFFEDLEKGTGEVVANVDEEIHSLEELITKCNIDTSKWQVLRYVQNYWGNKKNPHWQVKAWLSLKSEQQLFQDSFTTFLSGYTPSYNECEYFLFDVDKTNGCLVINKQDSHLNKFDIDGRNNIEYRLANILSKVELIAKQAVLSNELTNITYIIGSDEFNSEFTNATTKGTPQQNTHTHHSSFEFICEHEVAMISMLSQYAQKINVVYVSGNHDEFAGWYMIKWLESYFRNAARISFDVSPKYRKYISYGNSVMMFNHGDAIKPAKLASMFPIEYREAWSDHSNFYIFTGDKHHELSIDFNGIKFYQLPALSNAKSSWDDKHGYTCSKAEVTGFLIDELDGMTNIFKQYL